MMSFLVIIYVCLGDFLVWRVVNMLFGNWRDLGV